MSPFPATRTTHTPDPSGQGPVADRAGSPPVPAGSPQQPFPAGPAVPGRAATGDLEWP
ncbi:hypothetical protein GCM10009759_09800 [Kitasatospora saccharophila]|uniref:Uncharacterized protein n=1 Tax=Kitasatospora saccharophila TaxID=407973 RepID=A0ABN2WAV2_9ACTN